MISAHVKTLWEVRLKLGGLRVAVTPERMKRSQAALWAQRRFGDTVTIHRAEEA